MKLKTLLCFIAMFSVATSAFSTGPQWTYQAGKQTNDGQITVKSTDGSTTYTGTQNPTGSSAKVNQTAATQPPTVVVQGGGINRWSLQYKDRAAGLP